MAVAGGADVRLPADLDLDLNGEEFAMEALAREMARYFLVDDDLPPPAPAPVQQQPPPASMAKRSELVTPPKPAVSAAVAKGGDVAWSPVAVPAPAPAKARAAAQAQVLDLQRAQLQLWRRQQLVRLQQQQQLLILEAQRMHLHQQLPAAGMRAVFLNGGGTAAKESAGTGVFIPQKPGTPAARKKSTCSPVLLPAKVVEALNLTVDELGAPKRVVPANAGKSNKAPTQTKRAGAVDRRTPPPRPTPAPAAPPPDLGLPQEWIY